IGNPSLNHRYRKGFYSLFKTLQQNHLFYKHSFILNDKGYGSAIVMFLLVIILIITAIQMKLQKKWVNY
ncbi:hypothetical protein SJ988_11095, partial [Enterococcus faecium]